MAVVMKFRVSDGWSCGWFLFSARDLALFDGYPSEPCFAAGAATDQIDSIGRLPAQTQELLRSQGFLLLGQGGTKYKTKEFIWRVASLNEILTGRDVAEQGAKLADWIIKAFSDIRAGLRAT